MSYILRAVSLPVGNRQAYTLRLRETARRERGRTVLGYELRTPGGVPLFRGEDYRPGAGVVIDSDESIRGLLAFLALQPGDTDEEYFAGYTPEQLAFAQSRDAELLQDFAGEDAPPPLDPAPPFGWRIRPDGGLEVWWNGEGDPRDLRDGCMLLEALGLLDAGWDGVAPEQIGALTADPWIVADDLDTADDGTCSVRGRLWHWPRYQIEDPMEALVRDGEVVFPCVPREPQEA